MLLTLTTTDKRFERGMHSNVHPGPRAFPLTPSIEYPVGKYILRIYNIFKYILILAVVNKEKSNLACEVKPKLDATSKTISDNIQHHQTSQEQSSYNGASYLIDDNTTVFPVHNMHSRAH